MKVVRIISFGLLVVMSSVIGYGFWEGDFFEEGSQLLSMPWGIVSLVDIYTGIVFTTLWVWYRSRVKWQALLWSLIFVGFGFGGVALYVWLESLKVNTLMELLLGKHHVYETTTDA